MPALPFRAPVAVLVMTVALACAAPALAHGLRLYARIEGTQVSGYGFFLGGGRPKGSTWVARLGEQVLARGVTDDKGAFAFVLPPDAAVGAAAQTIDVTIDTGEGHMARATLPLTPAAGDPTAARLAPSIPPAPAQGIGAGLPPAELAALIQGAVATEVAPLTARILALETRLRLVDALSGLFLILGLAGMGLALRSRWPKATAGLTHPAPGGASGSDSGSAPVAAGDPAGNTDRISG